MNRADETIDHAADRLQETAEQAAAKGGVRARIAGELADDAAFLRKLKPSLMRARWRGEAPTDGRPARQPKALRTGGGPNPYVVVAAALVTGILFAKVIDWRGHAHPRD
jgi:hypothetical protein